MCLMITAASRSSAKGALSYIGSQTLTFAYKNVCFHSVRSALDYQGWVKNVSVFWQGVDAGSGPAENGGMRAFFKSVAFILCLSCFFLTTLPFWPWLQLGASWVRPLLIRQVAFYARLMMKVLGLRVKVRGRQDLWDARGGQLIVANHMSYVDVLLIASTRPACFVTSLEIKGTLGLGQIVQLAGCLFVDRQNKRQLGQEVAELTRGLQEGLDIVVFPEGTSTNGATVLRFKRPLFAAAIHSGASVLPVTINYVTANAQPVNQLNRDSLCWYGDMTFIRHFLALAKLKEAYFELHVGDALTNCQDVTVLSETAQHCVHSRFRSLSHPISYREVL